MTQLAIEPTVHVVAPRGHGFVGRYLTKPGQRRRTAVIVWGGSEGGLPTPEAALIASHGIPTLALAYFDAPGLPCSLHDIPLEYFARSIRWLRSQPQVDPRRVWIVSGSRGTEAELLVADHWPALVHGIVAESPSSTVYGSTSGRCRSQDKASWTLGGRPVPHALVGQPALESDGSVQERSGFETTLGLPTSDAARIALDRMRGPVLLISGGDDELWPSDTFADQIISALRSDPGRHVHLSYPKAGHLVLGPPSFPTPTSEHVGEQTIDLGGTPAGDDAAHRRDWPAMLSFIASN